MGSQTDLDQGGTNRQTVKTYLGPSVGWVSTPAPAASILNITAAGTYSINASTTLVVVNTTGAVILVLPSAQTPAAGAQAQPGLFVQNPITIVDIAGTPNVTIEPFDNTENVLSLASIQLLTPYGGYTLKPNNTLKGWLAISP